jgi:predicted transcriptional regulator
MVLNNKDKKKPTASEKKRNVENTLSVADRFYIENHGNDSIEKIANDLGKSIQLVKSYCEEWIKDNPPKKEKRASKLMDRPAKGGGVVSMTQAASMVGDEKGHFVTIETINQAIANGDVEQVKRLKEQYNLQEKTNLPGR